MTHDMWHVLLQSENVFELGGVTKSFVDPGRTRVVNTGTAFALLFVAWKQKVKVERP